MYTNKTIHFIIFQHLCIAPAQYYLFSIIAPPRRTGPEDPTFDPATYLSLLPHESVTQSWINARVLLGGPPDGVDVSGPENDDDDDLLNSDQLVNTDDAGTGTEGGDLETGDENLSEEFGIFTEEEGLGLQPGNLQRDNEGGC